MPRNKKLSLPHLRIVYYIGSWALVGTTSHMGSDDVEILGKVTRLL